MSNPSIILINLLFFIFMVQCSNAGDKIKISVKDTTITKTTAITNLVLDSMYIENFIARNVPDEKSAQLLRNFYVSRNYQYAWFHEDGLAEQTLLFWNLRNHYLQFYKDSALFNIELNEQMQRLINGDNAYITQLKDKRYIELQLTRNFFQYAQYAYMGKIEPEELQWFIPRKKLDVIALLDSLIGTKGNNQKKWEPINEQYSLLNNYLIKLAEIEKKAGWGILDKKKIYKKGNQDSSILDFKKRLFILDYLKNIDSSIAYDNAMESAVKLAQHSFGFTENGIINTALIEALNIPVKDRIQQVLINMERMRWLPEIPDKIILVANIPAFRLHIIENKKEMSNMNIVVGKAATSTTIFTDILKYIVFSPYWNVPESITVNEILPGMKKDIHYLSSKNMEITGYSNGIPIIRQKPGGSNSLGLVKFLFPNSFNIYFHDTPSKYLFKKEKRAFSHGCIRLEKPFEFAQYLLRNDTVWTSEKIKAAMHSNKEKWVALKTPIPVLITYFTSWVDNKGMLNFRDDIYGHDAKMKERLFQ